jgi:hypothetical protein
LYFDYEIRKELLGRSNNGIPSMYDRMGKKIKTYHPDAQNMCSIALISIYT